MHMQHQHAGEEASNILGDRLQQKMDAITFTQERMKRQLDDLGERTSVSKFYFLSIRNAYEYNNFNWLKTFPILIIHWRSF